MSSCVHFKFKSAKAFETITFSGSFIKLIDLKRAVVEAKSLQKGMDFDLSVVDNHSKEGIKYYYMTRLYFPVFFFCPVGCYPIFHTHI